jgi:hypothetical protein
MRSSFWIRSLAVGAALSPVLALVPAPAVALSAPRTLAAEHAVGPIDGPSEVVDPSFPLDYLGVSWVEGARPSVRFRHDDGWGAWTRVYEDEIPTVGGRTWSALVPAGDADAYQIRGDNSGVRTFAVNTTDGPRSLVWEEPAAQASHILQPPLLTRPQWGANESLRCNADGTPKHTWSFYPTGKLIAHHTATANNDPDPAATVRAIYEYHVQGRGWADIAYNFLVDANGTIYKGRYSGPNGTCFTDTTTGEDLRGWGVTGAHTGGWNSGTMGIAVLGTYTSTPLPQPARATLVEHLAWEAERHLLDPLATTTFTNPASGDSKTAPNISGHRDWTATQCPGEALYTQLPAIRQEVAARVGQIARPDTNPPGISNVEAKGIRQRRANVVWRTSEPATGQVRYWEPGGKRRLSRLSAGTDARHKVSLRGLDRDTVYRYVVLSRDAAGNLGKSRVKRFVTDA